MFVGEVGPDHQSLAVGAGESFEIPYVIREEGARRFPWRTRPGRTKTEVEGLVAIRVEAGRTEEGQELVVEIAEQAKGSGIVGRDRPVSIALREVGIAVEREESLHMSQGLQAGHEFDTAIGRITVEGEECLGLEGARSFCDLGMLPKGEGVFDVEHEYVHAKA